MKKRIVTLLLAVLCLFSALALAACGGKNNNGDATTETKKETTTADPGTTQDPDARAAAKSTLPEDLSFGDEDILIAVRNREDIAFEIDPEANNVDSLAKDIHDRNRKAEDTLNCNIVMKPIPGTWAEREQFMTQIRNNGQGSTAEMYDLIFGANYSLVPLMLENRFVNLIGTDYLDLDQPWWNGNFVEECTYRNKLYMIEGELTLSMLDSAFVVFYDVKNLSDRLPTVDPVELVQLKEWTLETLDGIVKQIQHEDRDNDGIASDGDFFAMVSPAFSCGRDGFPTAFNVKVTSKSENGAISASFSSQRNVDIYDKFFDFLENNESVYVNGNTDGARESCRTMFENGQVVFITELLQYASILRGGERDYGVLPLPMYDELQKDYYTNSEAVHSQISIQKASPRAAHAAALAEELGYLTYKNVTLDYYDTVKYRNMRTPESVAMMDLILGSITIDFGSEFGSEIGTPFPTPMGEKNNIAGDLDSQKDRINKMLNVLKNKIIALED